MARLLGCVWLMLLLAPSMAAGQTAGKPTTQDTVAQYLVTLRKCWSRPDTNQIKPLQFVLKKAGLPLDSQQRYAQLLRLLAARTPPQSDDIAAGLLQAELWMAGESLDSTHALLTALLSRPLTADQRAQTLLRRGQVKFSRGQYKDALADILKTQQLLKTSKDTFLIAMGYMQFALIYGQEGHRAEVIQAYKTAIRILEHTRSYNMRAIILNNLANVYYETPDSALYFLRQALSIGRQARQGKGSVGIASMSITEVFILKRQLDSARHYAAEAMKYLEEQHNFEVWMSLQTSLAQLAYEEKDFAGCISRLDSVIARALALQVPRELRDCYLLKAKALGAQNKWSEAYAYFERQNQLTDSLVGLERTTEMARLTETHNAAMRQARISQLKQESGIQQATIKEQNQWLIFAVVFMLCLGTLLTGGIITYRRLQVEQARLRQLRGVEEAQHRQLQATGRTKDQLLQIIANELRDPIGRWQELPDVLEPLVPQLDYQAMRHPLERFRQHTEEVSVILESLLSWAQAQRKSLTYAPQAISLKEICDSLKPLATLYNTAPVTIADAPPQLRLWADFATLETTLRNLVAQAIQQLPAGGALQMGARAHDDTIEVFFFLKENRLSRPPLANLLSQALITDLVHHNRGTLHHDHTHLHPGYLFSLVLPRATDARVRQLAVVSHEYTAHR